MTRGDARWQFWIDVGGTFTDCVARSPDGQLSTAKVLSCSVVKGRVGSGPSTRSLRDSALAGYVENFFRGFELRLLDAEGSTLETREVARFDADELSVWPSKPFRCSPEGLAYELASPEKAPLLCVRRLMGLRLGQSIGDAEIRLGTTRGTNALLERKGPPTAFVTTHGFRDILLIGNQDRPRLFDLEIRKPPPLFALSVSVRERIDANGKVLEKLDLDKARATLEEVRVLGIDSVAICLLHAVSNPVHEEALAGLAMEIGFSHVSVSSRVAPIPKLVPRGDTTVVDAYLSPVIDSYIESIEECAAEARLRFLTSAGGLSAPGSFTGKDSILSGPAGGVVGAARMAEAAGFSRSIGFDMGGTSTDVSRYDGEFEMEFETEKAGVRIVTPLLSIETVAAGGGSICTFDGERQMVGPSSAGAWPGPACYGSGGPLTITDVQLFLGRMPEERFPFPLDRAAVRRRFEDVASAMETAGHARSFAQIADGFLQISDTRMAAAIRRISVARGYDVRDYVLVTFGGAGAQHACAVARDLGMTKVLVPRFAGVLSAQGVGLADVRKFVETPVLTQLTPRSASDLLPEFDALEARAVRALEADGFSAAEREEARRTVELRYVGQDAKLEVDASAGDWRARFEEAHQQLYGFAHEARAVEIVTARVECVVRTRASEIGTLEDTPTKTSATAPESRPIRPVFFAGTEVPTAIVDEDHVSPGEIVAGPAVVAAPFHTIVVEPGWSSTRTERGDWLLERTTDLPEETAAGRSSDESADPVRLEIFHQHFASVAEEMGIVLRRSALSTNVRERLDFSCAIFDADGDLVANAPHIPVHLGAMSDCVRQVARDVPDLAPGDVIVTNDPFRGGSHLPDVTVVTPVHDEESGELLFYTASRAHHSEIGGKRPGSMPPDSRSLADEGVLLRNVRVIERGEPFWERLETLLTGGTYPSRSPQQNLADVAAQIAANRAGATLLSRLIEARGTAQVLRYMAHIQSAARRLMEAQLGKLPDGVRRFQDRLDDGARIVVELTIASGAARVDFNGTDDVLSSNLNATPAIVSSAVLYCFRCLIEEDIPLNAGVLAPIEIILPRCFLSPAARERVEECAAVAAGNVETSQRIVDTILGALGVVAASQGTMNNLLYGNERFGYYETIAGGVGAGPGWDGADAVHTHMTNTRITDPEVLEQRYPVRLRRFEILAGTGGEGLYRGGDGLVREIEFLEPVEVSVLSQRRTMRPWGVAGGGAGQSGRNSLRRHGEDEWVDFGGVATFRVSVGDAVRIETPGGGGWGRPGA